MSSFFNPNPIINRSNQLLIVWWYLVLFFLYCFSLGFQFDLLNLVLSISIFLTPLSSWVPTLFAKGSSSFGNKTLVAKNMLCILLYLFFWILYFKTFSLWYFSSFLSHKPQKRKKVLSLKSCVLFQFFCHCFRLWISFPIFL